MLGYLRTWLLLTYFEYSLKICFSHQKRWRED